MEPHGYFTLTGLLIGVIISYRMECTYRLERDAYLWGLIVTEPERVHVREHAVAIATPVALANLAAALPDALGVVAVVLFFWAAVYFSTVPSYEKVLERDLNARKEKARQLMLSLRPDL